MNFSLCFSSCHCPGHLFISSAPAVRLLYSLKCSLRDVLLDTLLPPSCLLILTSAQAATHPCYPFGSYFYTPEEEDVQYVVALSTVVHVEASFMSLKSNMNSYYRLFLLSATFFFTKISIFKQFTYFYSFFRTSLKKLRLSPSLFGFTFFVLPSRRTNWTCKLKSPQFTASNSRKCPDSRTSRFVRFSVLYLHLSYWC